ncbi:IS1182 family transposase [Streptomyces spirodelae]|uniref:IS1182 family transposase n=1 Tax=Streptomyces spirodelae TaxID=2812904 RepID=A0ABS3X3Z9_9ACTN|nr:IS1182 family transposase [Streptomyces spirodelae]MBO8190099.1 IS1182 family transposase [Streptomyces spirodelae]
MSLRLVGLGEIPAETARVARVVCPRGAFAMRLREEFAEVFSGEAFADLYSERGRPAVAPGALALVTVLQFVEGLSDRQAADAVRTRIDWKYAIGLELTDAGFDYSVLCEFRSRLLEGEKAGEVFDLVLMLARDRGLLKTAGRQRTDSAKVLGAITGLNRLALVGESLRAALNAIAAVAPDWLAARVDLEWFDRYGHRVEETRLPRSKEKQRAWTAQVGADGMRLMTALFAPDAPREVRALGPVEVLRQVWVKNYQVSEGEVHWREDKNLPPGRLQPCSPYDLHARRGAKAGSGWAGYLVQLTETCEPDVPNLITHVATTDASVNDSKMTQAIQADLAARDMLPAVHLADGNYIDAGNILAAQRMGVELLGPAQRNTTVQARGRFATDAFTVDWDRRQVTCPNGITTDQWYPRTDSKGIEVVRVRFRHTECRPCPDLRSCVGSTTGQRREITLRHHDEHQAIRQNRAAQETREWRNRYRQRNGIEATVSQGVRAFGMRRSRYRGQPKTHFQHLFTAAAMNLARLDAWTSGTPRIGTRISRFETLKPAA